MPPPRLTRPLRPCHSPRGPLQVRRASRRPRDTAASPSGDHTPTSPAGSKTTQLGAHDAGASSPPNSILHQDAPPAQSEKTRSKWWGSMAGSISKLLSESTTSIHDTHPYPSSTQDAPTLPSQPRDTDEAPSFTAKPGEVRPREDTIEEQRALADVHHVDGTDQRTVLATTAQETSSRTDPALLNGNKNLRKTLAHEPQMNDSISSGKYRARHLQLKKERSKVDAEPDQAASHKPNTIIAASGDLDVRQQLQQLMQQVRQLQAILDPPSTISQDVSKTSADTVPREMDLSSPPSHDKSKDVPRSSRKKDPPSFDSRKESMILPPKAQARADSGLRSSENSSPTTTFNEPHPLRLPNDDVVQPRRYQPLKGKQYLTIRDPGHQAQRNKVDSSISSFRKHYVSRHMPQYEMMPESSKRLLARTRPVDNHEQVVEVKNDTQGLQARPRPVKSHEQAVEVKSDTQRLTRQIHTHSKTLAPSKPSTDAASKKTSEQSLLEELFPGDSSYIQPHYTGRNPYPKLDLPSDIVPLIRREETDIKKTFRECVIESFQNSGEQVTALQFLNCSTEFTDSDFRRLVPKGKHIESWAVKGEFYKIIPGRDPISLDRLPFYYLLFKSPESALAYQANVGRLHRLCTLRQASNIMSVMPVPRNLLEDGEDINAAMTSYILKPSTLLLNLNMVMQPYNPALRSLLEEGGYRPIVPSVTASGKPLFKVLLKIKGWEPTQHDLYYILCKHADHRGISWPFHTESQHAIRKLRDLTDLKARMLSVSDASPRASTYADGIGPSSLDTKPEPDPSIDLLFPDSEHVEGNVHQMVMNRVYNRWIVTFDDEDGAKRFARLWNRRVLPQPKFVTWRETEEVRMVSAEFLW